jgi:hypothetical protein
MAKMIVAKKGDTLRKIAKRVLGDEKRAREIADYNAIPARNDILAGQQIWIPTAREMRVPPASRAVTPWPAPPVGYQAICETFGDLLKHVRSDGTIDPKWDANQMAKAALPFSIPLSWDTTKSASSVRCHKLIAPLIVHVFKQVDARGLRSTVKTYGGCYVYRAKRNGSKPSTHSWGIALDLNTSTNAMGTPGDMDSRLVALFEEFGFFWGGRWPGRGKDPMHFQYCSGY